MADEQAATQGEWLWGDDPLDDPRPPGSAFDEPLQWPDALDWPPPPLPLGDLDFQAPAAAPEAPAAPVPPPPLEPSPEPLDFDPGPVDEVAAQAPVDMTAAPALAAEPEVAQPPSDLDVIPTSIWGPVSALRSEPAEPGASVIFGDTPAPPVEDTQLSVQPIPESFWDQGPDDDPPAVAPVGPRPRIYTEPERTRAGGAAAWFQVRHPTAAMAGLAVFVVLVVVGLVLSVRNKPDSSVTDAAQKGGAISAQRLPTTTVIPTTTATTAPVAVIALQPPSTDPGATPADVGGRPASNDTAPAGGRTATATPTTRAAAPASGGGGGSSGGGGGSTPAATTGTTAAPDTTQPPATAPPDTTPASTSPPSTRRTTTIPPDFTVPSITTPTTPPPPTTPTSFDFTVTTRTR